jgi:hypothetical protein
MYSLLAFPRAVDDEYTVLLGTLTYLSACAAATSFEM